MISPDFDLFCRLAKKGNLIAVTKTISADIETPVSSFLKIADHEPHAFLLESAEQQEKIGRYSILGIKPEAILTSGQKTIRITKSGKSVNLQTKENLSGILEKSMRTFRLANPESLPGFTGGFLGYFSYEQVQNFESIHLSPKKDRSIPEGIFFLVKDFVVFDHFRKTMTFVSIVDLSSRKQSLKKLYQNGIRRTDSLIARLKRPLKISRSMKQVKGVSVKANMSKKDFRSKVKRIKEYIRAGDCIQVVLSQRFTLPRTADDFQIYRALRSINPSPYMFYFRSGKLRLIGSSPELLVRKLGKEAEIRPIAGTRPRGLTLAQDSAYEESLKRSRKEMAEHLMLVDLGRNDLGRVCEFNSVRVTDFARVERFSHVMHLVSDVTGLLRKGKNAFDLLKAAFPAGTVTGAPKIRAMQIIDEMERERRGPYAGCLGFFGFNQDMEMCITIRTLVVSGNCIDLQAGAGIVQDSNPDKEYQETINKAKALLKAIECQGSF